MAIGVSNFSVRRIKRAMEALKKHELASNQVEYNLIRRDPERKLIPFCRT
ncbi:MAG: hypothetical protein DRO05_08425 [Thermoproteota archaeon]|nr:MAG: hypothetical protein DRO05_08425 [Candidatus Korarchaeota archaeon]